MSRMHQPLPGPAVRQPDAPTFGAGFLLEFQWLRTAVPERLFEMKGRALRLTGRKTIGSWYEQALAARRQ